MIWGFLDPLVLGPVISQCPAFRPGRLVVCVVHALGSIFPDLGIPRSRLGFSCSPCAAGVECVPKKTQKKGRRRQERGAGFPRLRTYPRRHARRESPRLFQGCNIRPSDNSNENAKSALEALKHHPSARALPLYSSVSKLRPFSLCEGFSSLLIPALRCPIWRVHFR